MPRARRGWSRTRLAGHLPLLYFSAARSAVLRLGDGSLPLGLLPSAEYPSHSFETDPDDLLLIVTDGVVEVMDGNAKEFGLERVESLVTENCANPLKAIASSIFEAAPWRKTKRRPDLTSGTIVLAAERYHPTSNKLTLTMIRWGLDTITWRR